MIDIDAPIKLLESFKRNQISKILERIDTKLFEILYSKHVSPNLIHHFPRYELCFMSDEIQLEPNKLYIREHQGTITYSVIAPNGETIKDVVLEQPEAPCPFKYNLALMSDSVEPQEGFFYVRLLDTGLEYTVIAPDGKLVTGNIKKEELNATINSGLSLNDLEPLMPDILDVTAKKKHTHPFILRVLKPEILSAVARNKHIQWAPFTDYSVAPDNVSQIKKLINALYHARLSFIDLENLDVGNSGRNWGALKLLYSKTIDSAYEASYLLTHLDVDLRDMFSEELALILPLFSQIEHFAKNHSQEKDTLVEALQLQKLDWNAGKVAGIVVDQMRPDVDYHFLTKCGAVLPGYIDQLTQHIQKYSSEIKESHPKINKEKLGELQNATLRLLNDLRRLKGDNVFISLNFLKYIHIISNIITLSMSSLEQIGEFNDSYQNYIRDNIAHLKYTLMPTLFSLVDKIEVNTMLKPGTLSDPLMEKVKALYDAILYLPKKAVDFKTKGEELLEIEDPHFIELRLEMSYNRINKAKKALYKIQIAHLACEHFFTLLEQYKDLRMYQLPAEVKQELIKSYKLITPYMSQLDIDFNALLIKQLGTQEDWSSYLNTRLSKGEFKLIIDDFFFGVETYRRGNKGDLPEDHISFVLAKQNALKNLIIKAENSQSFHIDLNEDLINSVHKNTKFFLFPYREKESVYTLDESIPLQIEKESTKKSKLTKIEFQNIQDAYARFALIVKTQIATNPGLENKLDLNQLEEPLKRECNDLYNLFKPYLSSFTSSDYQDSAQELNQFLNDFFSQTPNINKPSTKLFLDLDKNIQCSFDRINFEWANETDFQKINSAYINFSWLIKNQIQLKPELYGNNLLLTHLDEHVKNQCQSLYQVFKPYLKLAMPPMLNDSAQNFEQYLEDVLVANKPLDILNAPHTYLFLRLDKEVLDFFARWKNKSGRYYDCLKKSFLSEEESNQLTLKRAHDAQFRFNTRDKDKILANREQLNTEQALDIRQWYQNKHDKLLAAQKAYLQFIEIIRPHTYTPSNKLFLNNLNPEEKDRCRNLYSIFQSYLICAAPTEMKENASKIDKYLVALLANKTINSEDVPSVQIFNDLNQHCNECFGNTERNWQVNAQSYEVIANQKFADSNNSNELKPDPNIGNRAHYVIQHTNYSKAIHEFRISLFEITKLFNKAMQAKLNHQSETWTWHALKKLGNFMTRSEWFPLGKVPFPEMEDENSRLAQSRQVCALKDIFNSLYHLEQIVLELENLNNKDAKSAYVSHLLKSYVHVNEIIKLSQRLVADPHLGFLAQELQDKAQNIYATFQEQSDPYLVGSEQVRYGASNVQNNPLWYVLNAFYIGPKHIRALKNINYLTAEERDTLHIRAKKTTLFIENIINSSDSYFKSFLQTPKMIYLYRELTQRLNEFTTTSHDAALDSLNEMRATILTPMLLEADRWEDKLGLVPGVLSGSLRKITDEFYKGLLHPLNLNSPTHVSLVCDEKPLNARKNKTNNQIRNARKYLKKLEEKEYKDIEDLYQCYLDRQNPSVTPDELDRIKENLRAAYQKALPKLVKLIRNKKINIEPSPYREDHVLDTLCNSGLNAYDRHFTEIEALIKASHHYYLGLKATHQMRLETAQEKLTYLEELSGIQHKENLTFIEQYTNESFDKYFETFCNRHVGLLQYVDKEYQTKLRKEVLTFKKDIIEESKQAKNINVNIQKRLKQKISLFEEQHFAEYYHLDSVRVALAHFKNYISYSMEQIQAHDSLFESLETLAIKSNHIDVLDTIATNATLSVKDRVVLIRNIVKTNNFKEDILNCHKQTNLFSFNYLKLCFLSLMEALNLYTPKRQKFLDRVTNAVNNPPEITELRKRFGLFASTPNNTIVRRYEAPTLTVSP